MNRHSLYAFYGTLRRGMSNHHLLGSSAKYISTVNLSGYKLYALIDYPYAVRSTSLTDTIVAELFYVPDLLAQQAIHSLELEAGYYYFEEQVKGTKYGIYLLDKPQIGDECIISGDWAVYVEKI